MHRGVVRKLRMKRSYKLSVLTGCHDAPVDGRKNPCIVVDLFGERCTDKGHRDCPYAVKAFLSVEASKLSAVGISADTDIHGAEAGLSVLDIARQKNHSGAGAEHRHAVINQFFYRFIQTKLV